MEKKYKNFTLVKLSDGSVFRVWKTEKMADSFISKEAKKGFRTTKYQSIGKKWVTI